MRIFSYDYYLARPHPAFDVCYSSFLASNVHQVPVIRLFGTTPAGQRALMHVHRQPQIVFS